MRITVLALTVMDFYTSTAIHDRVPIPETREHNVVLHFKLCLHGNTLMRDSLICNWHEVEVDGHYVRK